MGSPRFPLLRGADESLARAQDNISGQFQPVATALAGTPIMGAASPGWIALGLTGGFANLGTVSGSNYATAGYHKSALGYVYLKGTLVNSAGAAAGVVLATLPLGYRPSEQFRFAVLGNAPAVNFITVAADGRLWTEIALGAGHSVDITFSFRAE